MIKKSAVALAKHNTAPQLWISRVDAEARRLFSGDGIKIYNERGEFGARAHVTDDVPPSVVWIRDGWVGLKEQSHALEISQIDAAPGTHSAGHVASSWRQSQQ